MSAADRLRALTQQATPGPWAWPHSNVLAGDYSGGYDSSWTLVAAIHDAEPVGSADTRLIALAPDLAAWAADAADHIDAVGAYLASMSDTSPAVAQAEHLLARLDRILGKQP